MSKVLVELSVAIERTNGSRAAFVTAIEFPGGANPAYAGDDLARAIAAALERFAAEHPIVQRPRPDSDFSPAWLQAAT